MKFTVDDFYCIVGTKRMREVGVIIENSLEECWTQIKRLSLKIWKSELMSVQNVPLKKSH